MGQASYDVFISHASSDKTAYVIPLTQALARHGVSFWLDTAQIAWGDSVTMQINQGLKTSRYVLLCLSRNFLQRP
jgi:hypothetical protein